MFYSNIEPEPFRVWQTSSSTFCVYSPDIYDKNNQNIYIFGVKNAHSTNSEIFNWVASFFFISGCVQPP